MSWNVFTHNRDLANIIYGKPFCLAVVAVGKLKSRAMFFLPWGMGNLKKHLVLCLVPCTFGLVKPKPTVRKMLGSSLFGPGLKKILLQYYTYWKKVTAYCLTSLWASYSKVYDFPYKKKTGRFELLAADEKYKPVSHF